MRERFVHRHIKICSARRKCAEFERMFQKMTANLFHVLLIHLFITRLKHTQKSFTVVKNRKFGHVTCYCRKTRLYRTDL